MTVHGFFTFGVYGCSASAPGEGRMARHVTLQNPRTLETRRVKIGWNWTLFLLSDFFGLPLFLRGLNTWGAAVLALWAMDVLVPGIETLTLLAGAGLHVWLGLKGNEMIARKYLERGWVLADRDDDATHLARARWGLASPTQETA